MSGSIAEHGLVSPFERDEALIFAIGQIIAVWGAIAHLLGSAATAQLGADAVADFWKLPGDGSRVAKLLATVEADSELSAALEGIAALIEQRNDIVHGGPLYGARVGRFDLGLHLVNFRRDISHDLKFQEALPFAQTHLEAVRHAGGALFDAVHRRGLIALDAHNEAVFQGV